MYVKSDQILTIYYVLEIVLKNYIFRNYIYFNIDFTSNKSTRYKRNPHPELLTDLQ